MCNLPGLNATKTLDRVLVISRIEDSEVRKLLIESSFKIVERNPDFIVCYGGDGTILFGEREFPQVPKLIVKRTNIRRKCDYTLYQTKNILTKIRNGEFNLQKEIKIEARFKNRKLIGLNEIQVHTQLPTYAIRFSLFVNEKEFPNLIGDGAIISTPFGSTGYYKSTGGNQFKKGIGISFNNLHNKRIRSLVVSESSTIRVKVNRGPAWILADNNERFLELKDNDVSIIEKSASVANFIYVP